MKAASKSWEESFKKLEDAAAADTNNLEEQLQDLAGETRTLKATNQRLTESLKANDTSIQKVRAESIELNRQNAEAQERLQRVIQQKDREIVDGVNHPTRDIEESRDLKGSTYTTTKRVSITSTVMGVAFNEDLDKEFEATLSESIDTGLNSPTPEDHERAMNNADTVALDSSELFDATLQMSTEDFIHQNGQLPLPTEAKFDDLIDDTADVTGIFIDDMEESTVALDEETLAFAKRPYPVSKID